MSTASHRVRVNQTGLDRAVRTSGSVLRAANNVFNTWNDLKESWKKPTPSNVMWTIIGLSRLYTGIRRAMKNIEAGSAVSRSLITGDLSRGRITITPTLRGGVMISPTMGLLPLSQLRMDVNVTVNGKPVDLDWLSLKSLQRGVEDMVHDIIAREAPKMVDDARRILAERIANYESATGRASKSTGYLSSTIGWMYDANGMRLYADEPYGWWVEEGQRSFTGHHYLQSAGEVGAQRISSEVLRRVNSIITEGRRQ